MLFLALFVAAMICSCLHDNWKEFWLAVDGKQIMARITNPGLKPGSYDYEYAVNGIQYTGNGHEGVDLDENTHINGQAFVFVSSSHPWLSSPKIPSFSLWMALGEMTVLFCIEFFILKAALKPSRV
jgi:hypothetical protein